MENILMEKKLTYEEKEALKERNRKKMQLLLNYGFVVLSADKQYTYNNVNDIAEELEKDRVFILTAPVDNCFCFNISNMALQLLKPYLKDWLKVGQQVNKTNYVLFKYDDEIENLLMQTAEPNDDIQLVDTFEISFNKYTMPVYTNTAKLYSVTSAPTLTPKEARKILSLYQTIRENQENYFLLSNNVSHIYNMPMSVVRKLGENVISLKALNVLELIMIFASNSNAIFRQTTEAVKPFAIPIDFFKLEDFSLNQTEAKIIKSLNELKAIGLIDDFDYCDNRFVIHANVIARSIKQYSYKQNLHHYRNLNLQKQYYVYTFLNYVRYVKNIKHTETSTDLAGNEIKKFVKADKLTTTLEGLIYKLDLEEYMHDMTHLATILNTLQSIGIREGLLKFPNNPAPATKETVRYLLSHRDRLHEFFILNTGEEKPKNIIDSSSFFSLDSRSGRTLVHR